MPDADPILPRELTDLPEAIRSVPPPPIPELPAPYGLRITEFSRPFVATLDGVNRAYIEIYRAAKDSIAPRYDHDPHDLGLHVAVADLDHIERGHVSYLLPQLAVSILTLDPLCRRIMFDPDHRNALARKFCGRSGCAFLGERDMSNRRMALYMLPRTPGDVPRQRDTR